MIFAAHNILHVRVWMGGGGRYIKNVILDLFNFNALINELIKHNNDKCL